MGRGTPARRRRRSLGRAGRPSRPGEGLYLLLRGLRLVPEMADHTALITAPGLLPHLGDPDWAIVDCRTGPQYLAGHIPGAVHARLEQDLSGPIVPGRTGRHPLPEPAAFAEKLSGWGIDHRVQVVAYDDSTGSNAARLWWMLRWLGHTRVAVLEGGWRDWERSGQA